MSGDMVSPDAVAVPEVGMIWAQTVHGVIGRDGTMPWHLPEDLAHFRRTTEGHPVIMGRRTWESFPAKYRPLPGRTNIVMTQDPERFAELAAAGAVPVGSLEEGLTEARQRPGSERIWVIGGGGVFEQAAALAHRAVVTVIDSDADGDTYAPKLSGRWALTDENPEDGAWFTAKNGLRFRFEDLHRS